MFASSILYKYRYLTVYIYCNPRTPGCIGTLETFIWIYFLHFFSLKVLIYSISCRLRDQVTPNQCSTLYYSTGLEKPHLLFFLVLQLLNMNIVLFLKKMYTAQEGHKLLFLFCMNICMRKSISSAYKSNLNIISKLMNHVYWATGQVIVCALLIYFYRNNSAGYFLVCKWNPVVKGEGYDESYVLTAHTVNMTGRLRSECPIFIQKLSSPWTLPSMPSSRPQMIWGKISYLDFLFFLLFFYI